MPANPRWSQAWLRIRRAILARDNYTCQLVYPGCEHVASEVDHILARRFGGPDHPDNLRAACRHCNRARGDGTDPPAYPPSAW